MRPMNISIRRITSFNPRLIDELTRLEEQAFGDGGLDRWTFPVLIRHGAVYVLECNRIICGIADILRDWADPGLVFLVNFAVAEDGRGKGLGSAFLRELMGALRAIGVTNVQLTVAPENVAAIRMYEKAGFRKIVELPDEYGPGFDRLLYEVELEG